MLALALVVTTIVSIANAKGVFYALSANGIDIINPRTLTVEKRLRYDMPIPGTNEVLCTYCPRNQVQCSWGGAAMVKGKYVFVANSRGNRVIVIDIMTQEPIKSIPTDGFPYQVTYIAALDEVWVFCWNNSHLNVVGDSMKETKIHRIVKASSMMIAYSIKAQAADSYEGMMHGYLQTENCHNINPRLQYGVVSHFSEPGIHKIDLRNKSYKRFINVSSHDCKSTFGLAYSSVTKFAFVQCLGSLRGHDVRKMLVIDVKTENVVSMDQSVTAGATGTPYASPDGRYILVLNNDKIITYQMKDRQTPIKRLKDIPVKMPSRVAFVSTTDGYIAYVTLKSTPKIFTIEYKINGQQILGSISGIGKAADISEGMMNRYKKRYRKYFLMLLAMRNEPFSEAKFDAYARKMFTAHITRPIATGCGLLDRYVASPAAYDNKIAILDGKMRSLLGLVENVTKPRNVIWVK